MGPLLVLVQSTSSVSRDVLFCFVFFFRPRVRSRQSSLRRRRVSLLAEDSPTKRAEHRTAAQVPFARPARPLVEPPDDVMSTPASAEDPGAASSVDFDVPDLDIVREWVLFSCARRRRARLRFRCRRFFYVRLYSSLFAFLRSRLFHDLYRTLNTECFAMRSPDGYGDRIAQRIDCEWF